MRERTASKHRDALDGFRGLAVLLVILSHGSKAGLSIAPFLNFDGTGRYGVFLFFILSAYLLTSQLLAADRLSWRVWTNYGLRRVLRIYPPYIVALLGLWALSPRTFIDMTASSLLQHLALLRGDGVFWTIPVECTFYALLPFVAALCFKERSIIGVTIAFAGAVIAVRLAFPPRYTLFVAPFLVFFLPGCWLAFCVSRGRLLPIARVAVEITGYLALVVLLLMTPSYFSALTGQTIPITYFHLHFGTLAAIATLLLAGVVMGTGSLARLFSVWPLKMIGKISFGIYLWHMVVMDYAKAAEPALGQSGATFMFFAVSIALGAASWILIERPCTKVRLLPHASRSAQQQISTSEQPVRPQQAA